MSNIVVTENFKNLWKSGARAQVEAIREFFANSEYSFPVRASEQEPLPEELDSVLAAIEPTLSSGSASPHNLGVTLAAHAGSLGMRPETLSPVYYLAGLNEVTIGNRTTLLQIPERTAVPLVYTDPFPISISSEHEMSRLRSLGPDWLNRMFFMAYDSIIFDVQSFSSSAERTALMSDPNGRHHFAAPYTAENVETGWYTQISVSAMRYSGSMRLPTMEEIDAWFARIPVGIVLSFPFGIADVFNQYGMRTRDYEEARYREVPQPAADSAPRAGTATNVSAQDFSGEVSRRPARRNPAVPRPRTSDRVPNSILQATQAVSHDWGQIGDDLTYNPPSTEPRPSFVVRNGSTMRFNSVINIPPASQPPT